MNKYICGLIHIHSTHSYDGNITIKELSDICKDKGYGFIALTEHVEEYLFSWDDVPGNDSRRVIKFLEKTLRIDWVKNAEINKSEDNKRITLANGEKSLILRLNKRENKVVIELDGEKIYECTPKEGNKKQYIYTGDFDDQKMDMLVNECAKLSDKDLVVIPGLEFDCEGMHILAIGIEKFIMESKLEKLIDKIHENGGLAVLAHVVFYDKVLYEKLNCLDGIEVWNPRYEGRFSPSLKSLSILKRFRKQNRELLAFGGLDLHERYGVGKISTFIYNNTNKNNKNELSKSEILDSLRCGRFHISNGLIRFDSKNDPSLHKKFIIYFIRLFYGLGKAIRRAIFMIFKKNRIKHPRILSKILRHVF